MALPRTYYSEQLRTPASRDPLEGNASAEFCIIGAGLAGLTVALELARNGRSVIILDAEQVGFGASGRNGGFVGPAWSQRLDKLTRRLGESSAHDLYKLSLEGVDIVARNIAELAMPGIDLTHGKLSVARTPSKDAFIRRRDNLSKFGQSVEVLETAQVRSLLRTSRYHEALYYPDDFQINPLAYVRGIAQEVDRLGGTIFENSRVTKVKPASTGHDVFTAAGKVSAQQVVFASGGYTGPAIKPLFNSYVPVSTYVMLTESNPTLISSAIKTSYGVGDQRRAGDYYRLVDGGARILWGGRITTRVSEPRRLAELLHATMAATYPQLKALNVEYAWSGLMGYARHLMPQIRPIDRGMWSCAAFGGHGLNTTAIGGNILAEALLGQSDRWRLFDSFGFAWNGGPAGRIAVQAVYWWLQARDALGERLSQEADTGA